MSRISSKQAQVREIVKCGKNPKYFINKYVKIQHPQKGTIPFATYSFQDDCVEDFKNHRFNVILKSRQLGLSTLVSAYSVWLALFYKDKNILVIATKMSVAMNFIKKVNVALNHLPNWLIVPQITGKTKHFVEFSNGSSIKAIPTSEDAGRSEALSLLIVDEAAFVRNFDEIWTGLYPTLSTGGRAIVLSTPNGVGGQYYDIFTKAETGENQFNPIKLPWDVHPERDNAWFDNESRNLTRRQIAQELLCDFAASGDSYLTPETISHYSSVCRDPVERGGPEMNLWTWKYPQTGTKYVISADISRGDGADYSTCHVIDTEESEVAAEFRGKIPPDQFAHFLSELGKKYNNAMMCPESNTYGYAVLMKLNEIGYENIYYSNQKDRYNTKYGANIGKAGFSTQGGSRHKILTKLEETLRNKKIKIYSRRFVDELRTFIWKGKKLQAQNGSNDDLIMSLAIGVWLYDTNKEFDSSSTKVMDAMLNSMSYNKTNYDGNNSHGKEPKATEFGWMRKNPYGTVNYNNPSSANADDMLKWLLK